MLTHPDPELEALFRQLRQAPPGADTTELEQQAFTRYLAVGRGGTTPGGLPYPDPTDPISEGADAIRALAEASESLKVMSGFLTGSGIIIFGSTYAYKMPNGLVALHLGVRNSGTNAIAEGQVVGTLPLGFRPLVSQTGNAAQYQGGSPVNAAGGFDVNATGTISARPQGGMLNAYALVGNAVYFAGVGGATTPAPGEEAEE